MGVPDTYPILCGDCRTAVAFADRPLPAAIAVRCHTCEAKRQIAAQDRVAARQKPSAQR